MPARRQRYVGIGFVSRILAVGLVELGLFGIFWLLAVGWAELGSFRIFGCWGGRLGSFRFFGSPAGRLGVEIGFVS